jgi:hypothetical protein
MINEEFKTRLRSIGKLNDEDLGKNNKQSNWEWFTAIKIPALLPFYLR